MLFKRSPNTPIAHKSTITLVVVLALAAAGWAQDPTGRPDPKRKPPANRAKTPAKPPEPPTVTLTVLTTPPGSSVLVNGEDRGVTNGEGKLQFEKLPLG